MLKRLIKYDDILNLDKYLEEYELELNKNLNIEIKS